MTKEAFLAELENALSGLPAEDAAERLSFYAEMIEDRMEEGVSEEEAVAGIGPVSEIVPQILSEIPLSRLVKEKMKPKRALQAWEIVLLVLGFPLWFPLLLAALIVGLALVLTLWALLAALWAVEFALAGSALGLAAAAVLFAVRGQFLPAAAVLGAALVCAGLSLFLLQGCLAASRGLVILTKKAFLGLKTLFVRKEDAA